MALSSLKAKPAPSMVIETDVDVVMGAPFEVLAVSARNKGTLRIRDQVALTASKTREMHAREIDAGDPPVRGTSTRLRHRRA